MKLGRRWLYVLWIAAMVLWHQAGAAPSASHLTKTPQWELAKKETPPPASEFTLQGTDNLEDQSLAKRPTSTTAFLEYFTRFQAGEPIVTGDARSDLPPVISSVRIACHLIRGPPVGA